MKKAEPGSLTPDRPAEGSEPAAPQAEADEPQLRVVDKRWWARTESAPGADDQPPLKPTYVEELEQRISEKDGLLQSSLAKYTEAANEFEQAKVRLRREVAKDIERGKRAILVELLDVVDNLDRAIEAARETSKQDPLLQGVEMVRGQFLAKLEGLGVARIEALGQPFDPTLHDAVTTITTTDPSQDNLVLGVITPGYRIGEDVLRPASVTVGRLGSQGDESSPGDG